jgi:hypothetical protein
MVFCGWAVQGQMMKNPRIHSFSPVYVYYYFQWFDSIPFLPFLFSKTSNGCLFLNEKVTGL